MPASRDGHSPNWGPIIREGGRVLCGCGNWFPVELDNKGRPTSRRLCMDCRRLSSNDRERVRAPELPPNVARCKDCGCLLVPELGGAHPSPDDPQLCAPCWEWQGRMSEREARRRTLPIRVAWGARG
jgi:hypothetical protein